jgi:hypothetical protein
MTANDVIEAYVLDVMRRVPSKDRQDIGLELRGLLAEMLAERAAEGAKPANEAMALAMVRSFGAPADVAARYAVPGLVIIPAAQTRSFAVLALAGFGLQWALTLPQVFQGQPLVAWWFSAGLGAFWWPGFMVMMALAARTLRHFRTTQPAWAPRRADTDHLSRLALSFGLIGSLLGTAFMISLPWIAPHLPGPLPQVFAFDPGFLQERAGFAVLLWLAGLGFLAVLLVQGRWTALTRRLDLAGNLAWVALLLFWLSAGPIFTSPATDSGARGGLGLVILFVALDLGLKWNRQRGRLPVQA